MFISFTEPFKLIQQDYGRLTNGQEARWLNIYLMTWKNPVFGSIVIYRVLSNSLGRKICYHLLWILLSLLVPHRNDMELNSSAKIGGGLVIYHGSGLVVGSGIKAGKNLTLEHGVTLGNRIGSSTESPFSSPVIGDDCFIGCGAAVLGPVRLGDGAKVGANAVVLSDVPANCTAVGVPAKILSQKMIMK